MENVPAKTLITQTTMKIYMKIGFNASLVILLILGSLFFTGCQKGDSFPIHLQKQPAECGAVCLQMILDHFGKKFSKDYLVKLTKTDYEIGVSMLGVANAAEALGLQATGVRVTYTQLKGEVALPCILHWRKHHFVVLYKVVQTIVGDKLYIADPAIGLFEYDDKLFCDNWYSEEKERQMYGLALLLEKTEKFKSTQEQ